MDRNRIAVRAGTAEPEWVNAEPAVDEVLAEFDESTPEEVIALADAATGGDDDAARDDVVTPEAASLPDSFSPEAPDVVDDSSADDAPDGPSMDELFGDIST